MNSNSIQLADFARAAIEHAEDQHGMKIGNGDVASVDQIIDRERGRQETRNFDAIVLCYGAWFGEWICKNFHGKWIGLNEPTPPRIRVAGSIYSPLDAVRRRMMSESAATLGSLAAKLNVSIDSQSDWEQTKQINRAAWNDLHADPRFVRIDAWNFDRVRAMNAIDPWLKEQSSFEGQRILCLAAGGGTHGPLFAVAGGEVTVVDMSPKLLDVDRRIAAEHGLDLKTIETTMDDLHMISDNAFDVVVQPVSTCYIPDLRQVYREIARVLRMGGLYVSQHKQPGGLQAHANLHEGRYSLQFPNAEGKMLVPNQERSPNREHTTVEFIHSIESILGGLCRSGFVIEDVEEPPRADEWGPLGSPEHRASFLPPYIKIKARRVVSTDKEKEQL